jgi:hypothetical protein
MIVYPQSGATTCPDLLIGLGVLNASNYATAYENDYPTALYLVRHCNGAYSYLNTIAVPSITPSPPLLSARLCPNSPATPRERSTSEDTTRTLTRRTIPIGSIGAFPKPGPRR